MAYPAFATLAMPMTSSDTVGLVSVSVCVSVSAAADSVSVPVTASVAVSVPVAEPAVSDGVPVFVSVGPVQAHRIAMRDSIRPAVTRSSFPRCFMFMTVPFSPTR